MFQFKQLMLSIDPDDDDDLGPVPSASTQAAPQGQAAGDAVDGAAGGTPSIDLTGEGGDANSSGQRVSSVYFLRLEMFYLY